jgi:hypothetical protein
MSSYAVLWSEPAGELETGKLELERESIRFEGSHVHHVYYHDIEGVRIGHHAGERLRGRPAVVVDLHHGGPLRIGGIDGLGTVAELADELTRLSGR